MQAAMKARKVCEHVLLWLKGDMSTTGLPGRGANEADSGSSSSSSMIDRGDAVMTSYAAVIADHLQMYELHPKHLEWVTYVSINSMGPGSLWLQEGEGKTRSFARRQGECGKKEGEEGVGLQSADGWRRRGASLAAGQGRRAICD